MWHHHIRCCHFPPYKSLQNYGTNPTCFVLKGYSGVAPSTQMHLPAHTAECKGGRVSPHPPGCAPGGASGTCGRKHAFDKVSLCSQRVRQDCATPQPPCLRFCRLRANGAAVLVRFFTPPSIIYCKSRSRKSYISRTRLICTQRVLHMHAGKHRRAHTPFP